MEHRWGHRVAVDLAIRIAGDRISPRGAARDLSASGAYLMVCADLRPLSRVQIAMLPHRLTHPTPMVAAYVARRGKDGVEWCEYAPQAVLELLRYAAARRARPVPAADPWTSRRASPKLRSALLAPP